MRLRLSLKFETCSSQWQYNYIGDTDQIPHVSSFLSVPSLYTPKPREALSFRYLTGSCIPATYVYSSSLQLVGPVGKSSTLHASIFMNSNEIWTVSSREPHEMIKLFYKIYCVTQIFWVLENMFHDIWLSSLTAVGRIKFCLWTTMFWNFAQCYHVDVLFSKSKVILSFASL